MRAPSDDDYGLYVRHPDDPFDGEPAEDGVLERHRAATEMLHALCLPRGSEGSREWMMSLPARPGVDPDLIIGASLADIPRLRDEVAETRRRHESDARDLEDCRRQLREETADAAKAWGFVDALADALEGLTREATMHLQAQGADSEDALLRFGSVLGDAWGALHKAGRLRAEEPSR